MLVTLGIVATYVAIGFVLAKRDIPHAWERARETWSFDRSQRNSVKEQTAMTFLLWPVVVPMRIISGLLGQAVVTHDPQELKKQLQEQADAAEHRASEQRDYIKKLERELGIGE